MTVLVKPWSDRQPDWYQEQRSDVQGESYAVRLQIAALADIGRETQARAIAYRKREQQLRNHIRYCMITR